MCAMSHIFFETLIHACPYVCKLSNNIPRPLRDLRKWCHSLQIRLTRACVASVTPLISSSRHGDLEQATDASPHRWICLHSNCDLFQYSAAFSQYCSSALITGACVFVCMCACMCGLWMSTFKFPWETLMGLPILLKRNRNILCMYVVFSHTHKSCICTVITLTSCMGGGSL